jgi:ketosteroid isomerase-like protein
MSNENVEILRPIYDEWGKGRFEAGQELYEPEITVETFMPDAAETVTMNGIGEFQRFVRDWLTQWDEYRVTGERFQAVGPDRVLVSGRQIATGHNSGVEVESPAFAIWTFRQGKVIRLSLHYDRDEALEVAGVSE